MQRVATQIFVTSSVAFGLVGILMVLTQPSQGDMGASDFYMLMSRLLMAIVFIILPSFALSVAGRYLGNK